MAEKRSPRRTNRAGRSSARTLQNTHVGSRGGAIGPGRQFGSSAYLAPRVAPIVATSFSSTGGKWIGPGIGRTYNSQAEASNRYRRPPTIIRLA